MKKNYIKPDMKVIILQKQNMILMASALNYGVSKNKFVDENNENEFEDL